MYRPRVRESWPALTIAAWPTTVPAAISPGEDRRARAQAVLQGRDLPRLQFRRLSDQADIHADDAACGGRVRRQRAQLLAMGRADVPARRHRRHRGRDRAAHEPRHRRGHAAGRSARDTRLDQAPPLHRRPARRASRAAARGPDAGKSAHARDRRFLEPDAERFLDRGMPDLPRHAHSAQQAPGSRRSCRRACRSDGQGCASQTEQRMNRAITRVVLGTAALALAGCVSTPPTTPQVATLNGEQLGLAGAPAPAVGQSWWNAFGDPQLDRLVARALQGSPTLEAALARIREAQSQLSQARAGTYPQASFDAQDVYTRFSENYIIPPPYGGMTQWFGTMQATLTWSLDLFGKQQAQIDKTRAGVEAARLDAEAARL